MKDYRRILLLLALSLASCRVRSFTWGSPGSTNLEKAEELLQDGRPQEAIQAYRLHMAERLAVQNRPDWENPFFYLLLIGDIQLDQGQVDAALASYSEAEKREVSPPLVSDRYRRIGRWYEERGRLEQAYEFLERHRRLDDLLGAGHLRMITAPPKPSSGGDRNGHRRRGPRHDE